MRFEIFKLKAIHLRVCNSSYPSRQKHLKSPWSPSCNASPLNGTLLAHRPTVLQTLPATAKSQFHMSPGGHCLLELDTHKQNNTEMADYGA